MAIEIPPSVKRIIRFRIAGKENEGQIIIELFLGGWDAKNNKHLKESLLKKTIGSAPFLETYEISDRDTFIDPEYNTLSLWLRATDRASISLIAIEFSY